MRRLAETIKTGQACHVDDLTRDTGVERGAIIALLDQLVAQYVAEEVAPEQYVGTSVAEKYNNEDLETAWATSNDLTTPAWTGIYKSLNQGEDRKGFQIGHKTPHTFYEWFAQPENA